MKPLILTLLLSLLSVACTSTRAATVLPTTHASIRIALAGDSTVTPNAGWGNGFTDCFGSDVEVLNFSKGGRSSMSFIHESIWQKVLDAKPNYVLVQFGHNDQKLDDPKRGTDPETTYRRYMTQYIRDARAVGIEPILVTSISRRQWGDDGKIHSTLTPYVNVVKDIAIAEHVPLIDLHAMSIEYYEQAGREAINKLSTTKPSTAPSDDPADRGQAHSVIDNTHLNAAGSSVFGRTVARELVRVVPELKTYSRVN